MEVSGPYTIELFVAEDCTSQAAELLRMHNIPVIFEMVRPGSPVGSGHFSCVEGIERAQHFHNINRQVST